MGRRRSDTHELRRKHIKGEGYEPDAVGEDIEDEGQFAAVAARANAEGVVRSPAVEGLDVLETIQIRVLGRGSYNRVHEENYTIST